MRDLIHLLFLSFFLQEVNEGFNVFTIVSHKTIKNTIRCSRCYVYSYKNVQSTDHLEHISLPKPFHLPFFSPLLYRPLSTRRSGRATVRAGRSVRRLQQTDPGQIPAQRARARLACDVRAVLRVSPTAGRQMLQPGIEAVLSE